VTTCSAGGRGSPCAPWPAPFLAGGVDGPTAASALQGYAVKRELYKGEATSTGFRNLIREEIDRLAYPSLAWIQDSKASNSGLILISEARNVNVVPSSSSTVME
jgi:hypothetical protein